MSKQKYYEVLSGAHKGRVYRAFGSGNKFVFLYVTYGDEAESDRNVVGFNKEIVRCVIPGHVPFDLEGEPLELGDSVIFADVSGGVTELFKGFVREIKIKNADGSFSRRPLVKVSAVCGRHVVGLTFASARRRVLRTVTR